MADMKFNYFTAAEAGQYTFYRIPKALFTEKQFQPLSCEAKVLYGMMLDRMGLSIQNQWLDSQGRVYIIFTVENVMEIMGCQSQKAVRLIKELDTVDGIGLIEKKRIGLGRPNLIYVKNFLSGQDGGGDGRKQADMPVFDKKGNAAAGKSKCSGTAVLENTADAAGQDLTAGVEKPEPQAESRMNGSSGWGAEFSNTETCMETEAIGNLTPFFNAPDRYNGTGSLAGSVDNYKNAAPENHNSGCGNSFPRETFIAEKNHTFADKEMEAMYKEVFDRKIGAETENDAAEREINADGRAQFPETQHMGSEKQDSAAVDSKVQEVRDTKCNDTERNDTEINEIDHNDTNRNDTDCIHVYQSNQSNQSNQPYPHSQHCRIPDPDIPGHHASGKKETPGMDGCDTDGLQNSNAGGTDGQLETYRGVIRENIDYTCFDAQDAKDVDEFVELMADTMTVPDSQTIRIAGMERPASVVKSRFMKLKNPHIQYVMESLQKHTGKIWNIRAYLMTALYNSMQTINNYYGAEVRHDLYGC